ncbi:MAG: Hsp20/alpha crystallin family protein [Nitrospiraceae bacterium]|nr:Hsp20/alpha crystallin family protein [Nitrospiraceae bacterium]
MRRFFFCPPAGIYETGGALVFEMDLPGAVPGDIKVKVVESSLVIEGSKSELADPLANARFICMERNFRRFRRVIQFPVPVEEERGSAFYRDGVLAIKFPKRTMVKEIRIEIETR